MSLAQVTKETRLILKLGGVALVVIVVIFLFVSGAGFIRNTFFPAPLPPPEEKFGELPQILFPISSDTGSHEYKVNTISGSLPAFTAQLRVFKTMQNEPGITDLQEARNRMAGAGYGANETKISETVYRWSQADGSATITYDIVTHNFSLTTDYLINPQYQTSTGIPEKDTAVKIVINLLDSLGANHDDIDTANSEISYSQLSGGRLEPTEDASLGQFTGINFIQNQLEKTPIVYPGGASTLNFLLASINHEVVVDGNYPHIQASTESSTYPIKTSMEAFADLQNGNAYIIQAPNENVIDIKDVQLAYYIGQADTGYVIPVFVFTGNNFKAYVSAIAGS